MIRHAAKWQDVAQLSDYSFLFSFRRKVTQVGWKLTMTFPCSLYETGVPRLQTSRGIMGCSSSVSVMDDEVEDTGVTRVIYTDRASPFSRLAEHFLGCISVN